MSDHLPNQAALNGSPPRSGSSVGIRIGLIYAVMFLGVGVQMPFFPVWLSARGLGTGEIATVLAMQLVVRVVAGPAVGYAADRIGSRRGVVIALCATGLSGLLLLIGAEGYGAILSLAVLSATARMSALPLIETIAVAESEAGGADYGRMRLWGSLTFIAGSIGAGAVLARTNAEAILWLLIAVDIVLVAAAVLLPGERTVAGDARERQRTGGAVRRLVCHPVFLCFLASAGLVQAAHAVYYGFGTLHWRAAGIGEAVIGALWATGVVAEVVLFAWAGPLVAWLKPQRLLLIGATAAIARWAITALEPSLWLLFAVQASHALTYGATHLGSMYFLARAVPGNLHATAQSLYHALTVGVIMGPVMAASGPLYHQLGAHAWFAMAGLGVVAAGFALVVVARWQGGRLMEP